MPPKGRKSERQRKVSKRMSAVDDDTKKLAVQQHLDALENDEVVPDALEEEDDEDVLFESDEDDRHRRRGRAATKRKTRQGRGALKTFNQILEDAEADPSREGDFLRYTNALVGPPKTHAPLKICSICGNASSYQCPRCSQRYCSRKCFQVHSETRCLKFMA